MLSLQPTFVMGSTGLQKANKIGFTCGSCLEVKVCSQVLQSFSLEFLRRHCESVLCILRQVQCPASASPITVSFLIPPTEGAHGFGEAGAALGWTEVGKLILHNS